MLNSGTQEISKFTICKLLITEELIISITGKHWEQICYEQLELEHFSLCECKNGKWESASE